ncbi:MAG: M14 family metallopeptidase [Candidatus Kariarchaeaceae archaeon]|jgi:murein tripeptide amidase MpaA
MTLEQLPMAEGFDFKYYKHGEIKTFLEDLTKQYPTLMKLEVIGKTFEGRDIWAVSLTNFELQDGSEKPAYYIDGNIHAGEVSGSTVSLYTIYYLCKKYGQEEVVTSLLDKFTFYIIPRISADGSERYLTTPKSLRSSTRFWPYPEKLPGFHSEDINGDGHIVLMRKEDPLGDWKTSKLDPRILTKRRADETDNGPYYRIFPEGMLEDWNEGDPILLAPPPEGLDLNRNNPVMWSQEYKQRGAGPFPLSEPETRAVADFLREHTNINGITTYHTFSGLILRPYSFVDDDAFETHDLEVYEALGKIGEEITDYPCINVFKDFTYERKEVLSGGFDDYVFESLGIFSFTTELWDMVKEAGIEKREYIKFLMYDRTEEEDLKLLQWNDKVLNGEGFMPWTEFDHPQIGKVEIGGWKSKFTFQNPPISPSKYLEETCHKNAIFTFAHAKVSPRLIFTDHKVEKIETTEGFNWKITLSVVNEGFLPTYCSMQALQRKVVKENELRIECGEGAELLVPTKKKTKFPHLQGRSNKLRKSLFFPYSPEDQKWTTSLVIHGKEGSEVRIDAYSERAGTAKLKISLD